MRARINKEYCVLLMISQYKITTIHLQIRKVGTYTFNLIHQIHTAT